MDKPIENFWQIRLADVKTALEANNFEVFLAEKQADVHKIVLEDLIPQLKPKTISWGGSMTFTGSGLSARFPMMKKINGAGRRCMPICSSPEPMPSPKPDSW
jgi:hypothetical protein